MSVDCRTYLIYGEDIGYATYEKYEEELCDSDNIIVDGMSGDYCYYGVILGRIDDNEDGKIIVNSNLEDYYEDIKYNMLHKFGVSKEPKLIMFNHFS